jgi:hypothetical protein
MITVRVRWEITSSSLMSLMSMYCRCWPGAQEPIADLAVANQVLQLINHPQQNHLCQLNGHLTEQKVADALLPGPQIDQVGIGSSGW